MAHKNRKTGTPKVAPSELWMLWNHDSEDWCLSLDDAPAGETFLVALTEKEAKKAAKYQNEQYETDCVPVRVK